MENKVPYISHFFRGEYQIGGEVEERKDSEVQCDVVIHVCIPCRLRLRQENQEEVQGQLSYVRP